MYFYYQKIDIYIYVGSKYPKKKKKKNEKASLTSMSTVIVSCLVSADVSVSSPRMLFISIVQKKNVQDISNPEIFGLVLKQKH